MGSTDSVQSLVLNMTPPPGTNKRSNDYRAQRALQKLAEGHPTKIPATVLGQLPPDLRPQYLGDQRWFLPPSRQKLGRALECLLLAGWR